MLRHATSGDGSASWEEDDVGSGRTARVRVLSAFRTGSFRVCGPGSAGHRVGGGKIAGGAEEAVGKAAVGEAAVAVTRDLACWREDPARPQPVLLDAGIEAEYEVSYPSVKTIGNCLFPWIDEGRPIFRGGARPRWCNPMMAAGGCCGEGKYRAQVPAVAGLFAAP